jgi:hypothetical protein
MKMSWFKKWDEMTGLFPGSPLIHKNHGST